jgi:hypothetical protein
MKTKYKYTLQEYKDGEYHAREPMEKIHWGAWDKWRTIADVCNTGVRIICNNTGESRVSYKIPKGA